MKTIKEAATEHANRSQFLSDFPHDWNSEYSGFLACAAFAESWIKCTDELPPIESEPYQVLVKLHSGSYTTLWINDKASLCFLKAFDSWRPINRK